MKFNKWTVALVAAGAVSLASAVQAEEAKQNLLTAVSSTTLSGYVDTSAIWKFGSGNAPLVGRSFDGAGKQDGFNLNAVKVSLEKPLEEGDWAAGYKADLLFGPDAVMFNTAGGGGDVGIKQAYVNLRAPVGNGIELKMGVFDTIIGYEVFDSVSNPNYSRSYGYSIEPTQHTGLLASYRFTDWFSLSVGVANTYSSGINARATRGFGDAPVSESEKTYMASATFTAPESWGSLKGSALYLGVVNGLNNAANPASFAVSPNDITSWYAGVSVPLPVTGLSVGAAYDYRGTSSDSVNASTWANATALYLSYQATEKLKLNGRAEYASGNAGTWYASADQNELFGGTLTADYALWANVVTRAELRWDTALSGGAGSRPFGTTDKSALSVALNVIYKF
jgi:hypothetical protein